MSSAKKIRQAAELSANDVLAKRWLDLKEKIAKLKAEQAEITKMFKHSGSFNTRSYQISVITKKRTKTPNLEEGLLVFGEVFKLACCKVPVTTVSVNKKGEL